MLIIYWQRCLMSSQASGGDADDEDFFVTIKFNIFAKPDITPEMDLKEVPPKDTAGKV